MWLKLIFVFCICVTTIRCEDVARYDNYRLYAITPYNEQQVKMLQGIQKNSDSVKFLSNAISINKKVSVIVAPHKFPDFGKFLIGEQIANELVTENLQKLIDEESLHHKRSGESFGWNAYYSLESIHNWLRDTADKYPNVVKLFEVGRSFEGRTILGAKISYKSGNPGIFIEGGIHAREWITPAFTTYLLNTLISSKDETIRTIAENYDWYIVPSTNPDGYAYSYTTDRFWRKTRHPYSDFCVGADPNRNWDFHWNAQGTSPDECSEVYAGPYPFSEIETKSYAEYLFSLKGKINAFIGFHSYSQFILFPYGHTLSHAENYDELYDIAEKGASALSVRYGTKYTFGSIMETIYPASGTSLDYIYGVLNVTLAYSFELRPIDGDSNGFELPPDQIIPTSLETIDGVVAMLSRAKQLGYFDSK